MTIPPTRLFSVLLALLFVAAPARSQNAPQTGLPRTQIAAGMYLIDAQVALTPDQQAIGLMHRRQLPTQEGMLFVFPQSRQQCFWMKNTLIPLTAAFIADDGRIVNLADMAPGSETPHCSKQPVRFVLEVNQGWFTKRGIRAGFQLRGPAFKQPS